MNDLEKEEEKDNCPRCEQKNTGITNHCPRCEKLCRALEEIVKESAIDGKRRVSLIWAIAKQALKEDA